MNFVPPRANYYNKLLEQTIKTNYYKPLVYLYSTGK